MANNEMDLFSIYPGNNCHLLIYLRTEYFLVVSLWVLLWTWRNSWVPRGPHFNHILFHDAIIDWRNNL